MSKSIDWFKVSTKALRDWRIRDLATQEAMSFGDAFHLCCLVWCQLYERGGGLMPEREVDAVAEYPGMARAMVSVGLADDTPEGLRIHGDERAQKLAAYREGQREKSIAANEARHRNGTHNKLPAGSPAGKGLPSPDISPLLSSLSGSSPDSGSGESSPRAVARSRQSEARALALAATESWVEWFNRNFTRAFRTTQELSRQVGALLAQGHAEKPDMRGVALYLASRWEDDPKMAVHLVPSTILRVTKFSERLDLAREWDRTANGARIWGPQ